MIRSLQCAALLATLGIMRSFGSEDAKPNKYVTNSLGMKFVWIPQGSFLMGSPETEPFRQPDETQHKVTLTKGFYMGIYLVTQEEWQSLMLSNPSYFKDKLNPKKEKKLPVESFTWEDCQAFIQKLSKKDKRVYRLPTEAEWEYACRAGTTTLFYFGGKISTDQANYNGFGAGIYGDGKDGLYRQRTTPVGSFPPNAFGLYDMHGNLFQLCNDWYAEYSKEPVVDPRGPEKGKVRVLRSTSWHFDAAGCRSAHRSGGWFPDNQGGFRVCFDHDNSVKEVNPKSGNSPKPSKIAD